MRISISGKGGSGESAIVALLPRVVTVYEATRVDVTPLNLRETLRRRP